jgi:hypothetical protein
LCGRCLLLPWEPCLMTFGPSICIQRIMLVQCQRRKERKLV